ncbi:MAG: DHA2 family efflux MFS transporter permease subunit [Pseudomonadota bacterium]|nr:DHA2 family efflux MFS transporter permease subunit [Pseudomonadota bacterium]
MSTEGKGDARGAWHPAANPWLIAIAVTLAAFMEVLDTTIVNVALPHVAGTMSVSYDEATWALTAYLVANSVVLPMSAYLARTFGRKRFFLVCIVGFTACSFLCGISTDLTELIIFRILQGLFGGGLQPNQQSIILDTFQPSQRGKAFAVTAIATVVAPVLGPTLGGLITDNFTWRWVFLINVPIGILTTFAVMGLVEDPPWAKRSAGRASTDFVGIGLISLGFAALQIMLDRGEDDDWFGSTLICAAAAIAAIGLASAVAWLFYTARPVVNLRVMRDRNFSLGCLVIAAFAIILYGSSVTIPQLAQQHLGYTATLAGLVLSPGALCVILMIPIIQRVMPHVQTRFILTVGFFLLGCSLLYSRNITADIDFWHLVWLRCAQSASIGFLFVPASTLAYLTVPRHLQADAAALFTMFRNIAGSIGISLSTAAITTRTQAHMAYLAAHMAPTDSGYADTLARTVSAVKSFTITVGDATQTATAYIYQNFSAQAGILAYMDIFLYCAFMSFAFIPVTFLFTSAKASGGGAAQ